MKFYLEKVIKDPNNGTKYLLNIFSVTHTNISKDSFEDLLKQDKDLYPEQELNIKNVTFLYNLIFENGNHILQELSKYPPIDRGGKGKQVFGIVIFYINSKAEVVLSAEFVRLMFTLDSSSKSKMDFLSSLLFVAAFFFF